MNPEQLLQHFDRISEAPDAIPRSRRFILDLAVRGKLVEQDPNDETAGEFLKRIETLESSTITAKKPKNVDGKPSPDAAQFPFDVPASWAWNRLGHLGKTQTGTTPSKTEGEIYGDHIPFIKPGDIFPNCVDYSGVGLSEIGLKSSGRLAPESTLLMVCIGTIGKCQIIDRDCSFNQQINALTPHQGLVPKYLLSACLSEFFQQSAWLASARTTIAILNKGKWEQLLLPIPPLAEQHRIVAKVDELMALCDRLQAAQTEREQSRDRLVAASLNRLNQSDQSRRPGRDCRDPDFMDESDLGSLPPDSNPKQQNVSIMEGKQAYFPVNWIPAIPAGTTGFDDVRFVLENLPRLTTRPAHIKQLRQTILSLAVRGKLVPQNPDDEPAAEVLKRIQTEKTRLFEDGVIKKRELLPNVDEEEAPFELPKNWAWSRLGNILIKLTDGTHHSPPNYQDGDFKYVTAKNIKPEGVSLSGITYVSGEIHREIYARCNPAKGDILYIKDGATTGVVTINDLDEPFSMLSSVALLKLPSCLYNRLIVEFLRSPFFYDQMRGFMKGAAITRVTLKRMSPALIPLPPLAEQHRIVAKVDELMALCDQLETQLTRTAADSRRLLEALLHEALVPASEQAA